MSGAMLPIYYGTSFLTFCQISGLNEAFEKIIKYQTALKFEFYEHASDWPEDFHHPTYAYFFCNRDLCRAMLPIYLGTSFSTICQVWALDPDKAFECLRYETTVYFRTDTPLRGITLLSTGIISQISCFIVELLLYVAYLSSCFGNFKMVTECEPKPISMDFGSPRGGGEWVMCGRHGTGLDWPEKKDKLSGNVLVIFAAIKIWLELCCQSTMGNLPQLSVRFQAWRRHLRRLTSTKLP